MKHTKYIFMVILLGSSLSLSLADRNITINLPSYSKSQNPLRATFDMLKDSQCENIQRYVRNNPLFKNPNIQVASYQAAGASYILGFVEGACLQHDGLYSRANFKGTTEYRGYCDFLNETFRALNLPTTDCYLR
ncbi:hypothetical protein [Helicobacter sp. T3_23-1056]